MGRCKSGKTMYRIYECMCMMRSIWGLGASLRKEYEGRVHVKIYGGAEFDYIKKYGSVSKSMLVINEKKAVTKLTKQAVRNAFEEALKL